MLHTFYTNDFPVLDVADKYILREQDIKDSAAFYDYYSNSEVSKYILASSPQNLAEAGAEIHYCQNLFRYKRGVYWTLARKKDDLMIGAVGLYINNQHHRAEICYDLSYDYWGKGIMTEALIQVLNLCFKKINLVRVEAITLKENEASIRILKKLGFEYEGCLKNYRYFNEKAYNVELLAITPERYFAKSENGHPFAKAI